MKRKPIISIFQAQSLLLIVFCIVFLTGSSFVFISESKENADPLTQIFSDKSLSYWIEQAAQKNRPEPLADLIKALSEAIRSDQPAVIMAAADALADLGSEAKDAIQSLIGQLDNHLPYVRVTVMGALSSIGLEAVPALIDTFQNQTGGPRIRSAFVLGAIGHDAKAALPVLIEGMKVESEANKVRLAGIIEQIEATPENNLKVNTTQPSKVDTKDSTSGTEPFNITDWPQFHGPLRNSICQEKGLLQEWPEGGPKLLWQLEGLGRGFSAVSIAGGKLFTMGDRLNSAGKEAQFVIAIDLNNKQELWAREIGPAFTTGPRCTPSIDGNLVYALGTEGDLMCLTMDNGIVQWHVNLVNDFGGKMMSGWKYSESPLVDDNQVICTPGGEDAAMIALDKKTGKVIWKTKLPEIGKNGSDGAGYSSAVIAHIDGVKQYVQLLGRGAVGVDAKTGKFLWGYNRIANNVANITAPMVLKNYVFTTTAYNTGSALLKISQENGRFQAEEMYFISPRDFQNHHGGVVLKDGYIYGGHGANSGDPACIELATGKVVWKQRAPARGSAGVLYADGHIIFRYDRGEVLLIEATPAEYRLKGRFLPPKSNGPAWAHPVIHQGKLYLRHDNLLLCYDVRT